MSELAEAAAQADALARRARSASSPICVRSGATTSKRLRAAATFASAPSPIRAIGQFRWRAKEELLRRGLDDESPAARGSALLSIELLSRDHPSTVNNVRSLLHTIATADGNAAVRRLAILSLKNGSPQRETIVLLEGLGRTTRPMRSYAGRRRASRSSSSAGRRSRRSTRRS